MSTNKDENAKSIRANNFKNIYSEAVSEGMSILGESASLVTSFLERKYSISLSDTDDNPKILAEALGSAIDGGARVVERRILRLLYEKMNMKLPSVMLMTVNFEEKVNQARQDYYNHNEL